MIIIITRTRKYEKWKNMEKKTEKKRKKKYRLVLVVIATVP